MLIMYGFILSSRSKERYLKLKYLLRSNYTKLRNI